MNPFTLLTAFPVKAFHTQRKPAAMKSFSKDQKVCFIENAAVVKNRSHTVTVTVAAQSVVEREFGLQL
jgi:hypothetical protein